MTAIPLDVLQFLEMAGPTCEVAFSEEMAKIANKKKIVTTAQEGLTRLFSNQQQVGRRAPYYLAGGDVTRVTKKRKRDATGTFATPRSTLVPAETGTFATARPTLVPAETGTRPRINLEGITPPQPSTATPSARQPSAPVEKSAPSGPAQVNLGRGFREPGPSIDAMITRATQTGARADQSYPGFAEQIAAIRQAGIASDAAGPVGTPKRVLEDLAAELQPRPKPRSQSAATSSPTPEPASSRRTSPEPQAGRGSSTQNVEGRFREVDDIAASAGVDTSAANRVDELGELLANPSISGQRRAAAQAEINRLLGRSPRPRRAAAEATPVSRPTPSPEPAGAAETGGSSTTYTFDDVSASTGPRSADQSEALGQGDKASRVSPTTGAPRPVSENADSSSPTGARFSERETAPSDRPTDAAPAPSAGGEAGAPPPSGPSTPGGAAEAPGGVNPRRFEEIRERLAEMFPASTVNNIMGIAAGMGTAGVKKLSDAANLLRTDPEVAIRAITDPVTGVLAESANTANKINLTFQGMRVGVTGKSVQMIDSFRADSLRLKNIDDQIAAAKSQLNEARRIYEGKDEAAILGFGKKYEARDVQKAEAEWNRSADKIDELYRQRDKITKGMKSQIDSLPEGFNNSEREGLQKIVDDLSSDAANVDEVISRLSSDDIYKSLGGQPLPVEQINMIRGIMGDLMPPPGVSEQADEAAEGLAAALGKEIDPAYLAAAAGTGLAAGFMLGGD